MADPMWFIANIIERYASGMAKTFTKLANAEAETEPQTPAIKARREANGLIVPDREDNDADCAVLERVTVEVAVVEPVAAMAPEPAAAAPARPAPAVLTSAPKVAPARALPMGVRGEVVMKWLGILAAAERREMADVLEKMRKDKKVRVAELQIICCEALGEPPQFRKKAEHLAVLRGHFVPVDRPRTLLLPEVRAAAN